MSFHDDNNNNVLRELLKIEHELMYSMVELEQLRIKGFYKFQKVFTTWYVFRIKKRSDSSVLIYVTLKCGDIVLANIDLINFAFQKSKRCFEHKRIFTTFRICKYFHRDAIQQQIYDHTRYTQHICILMYRNIFVHYFILYGLYIIYNLFINPYELFLKCLFLIYKMSNISMGTSVSSNRIESHEKFIFIPYLKLTSTILLPMEKVLKVCNSH